MRPICFCTATRCYVKISSFTNREMSSTSRGERSFDSHRPLPAYSIGLSASPASCLKTRSSRFQNEDLPFPGGDGHLGVRLPAVCGVGPTYSGGAVHRGALASPPAQRQHRDALRVHWEQRCSDENNFEQRSSSEYKGMPFNLPPWKSVNLFTKSPLKPEADNYVWQQYDAPLIKSFFPRRLTKSKDLRRFRVISLTVQALVTTSSASPMASSAALRTPAGGLHL